MTDREQQHVNQRPEERLRAPQSGAPQSGAPQSGAPKWRNRYRLLLGVARAALYWERLWPAVWPALGVAALFVSVALLDLLPMLPFWLHSLVLIGFASAFGFLVRGIPAEVSGVDDKSAEHRLERDSGLQHRPLTALHDTLLAGQTDAGARGLWKIHLRRMADAVHRLRVALPSPGLAGRDPYAFRAVAVLLLVIAAAVGGADATARLGRAMVPKLDAGGTAAMELEMWITPPAYTGLAPMFLDRPPVALVAADGTVPTAPPVVVPVGSGLLAQAGGAGKAPELVIGGKTIRFAAIGDKNESGSYRVETILDDADRAADTLEVRLGGRSVARWPLRVVADVAPEVEFTRAPARAGRAQLRIGYEARDDYGLAGLQVVIRHPEGRPVPGGSAAIRAELPLPGLGSNRAEGESLQDFSAHPWAGTPVLVQLQAIDARGQAGESDRVKIVLPERIFNHPVARAIVEARKKLNTPDPGTISEVVATLHGLASRPKHFFDDTIVFLALTVGASRLVHDGSEAGVGAVQELLWATALRIEDGEFAIAERDLREIQERLMRAMRDGKDTAEIERLLDELQQALDKYMAALAEHLEKQGLTQLPIDPTSRMMESTDLQRMIDEAREMFRTGALDAARKMLSDLRRMLDGIRSGMQRGQPRKDMAEARRLLDGLRSLTERQRQELDKTFRRQREAEGAMQGRPPPGGQQGQAPQGQRPEGQRPEGQNPGQGAGSAEQQALRRELGRLMLRMDDFLGAIPKSFGRAERAMNDAVKSLEKSDFDAAVPQQTEALDQLQKGLDGMSEQIARRMGGAFGMTRGQQGRRPGTGQDPFGRNPGGAYGASMDDGEIKVPDQMERRRAWDILQELRRRAGERERPPTERDYIDRLLKRF